MDEELIECSCCGKMVAASDLELSFRRPDEIASLSDEERDDRCEHDGDIYTLDGKKYFVRCIIPLPVHECGNYYAIGAWAEVSKEDYKKIWELWDDKKQNNEEPIGATLANHIPKNENSLGCSIAIKLSSETRPHIIIADKACSLFQEQECGISIHRANEYSDEILNKENKLVVVEEEELEPSFCSCCDNKISCFCGHIEKSKNDEICADYWLRIPEGHKGYFTTAISIKEGGEPRVAVLLAEATNEGLRYWVQDREQSPWEDFGEYGQVMDREEVIIDKAKNMFFDIMDEIAGNDSRLIAHIEPYLNEE